VTQALGAQMLMLGGVAANIAEAEEKLQEAVSSGRALAKFREIIIAQGGDGRVVDEPSRLPQARHQVSLAATADGHVADVDAMGVALAALRLGAGRARAEDKVDPAVGVSGLVKMGERISAGSPLCVIHANDATALAEAQAMLAKAIVVGNEPGVPPGLIDELIG
jgi:thymidine phosphorylase